MFYDVMKQKKTALPSFVLYIVCYDTHYTKGVVFVVRYFKFSGFNPLSSFVMKMPSFRIRTSSK
jgi:hypothetical protein